jgi:hypothetical protein
LYREPYSFLIQRYASLLRIREKSPIAIIRQEAMVIVQAVFGCKGKNVLSPYPISPHKLEKLALARVADQPTFSWCI